MTEYTLEEPFLGRFRTALEVDNADDLLQVVKEAAHSSAWPDGYWLSVRVAVVIERPPGFVGQLRPVLTDLASAVGRAGQPDCFLATLRFIFENAQWASRSKMEKAGRIARLPVDVMEYVRARLSRLMSESHGVITEAVIRAELEALYDLCFAVSNGEAAAEEIFGRINSVAAEVVLQARAGREAEEERAAIVSVVKSANSEAKSNASARRSL